jgi:hypothetical protein
MVVVPGFAAARSAWRAANPIDAFVLAKLAEKHLPARLPRKLRCLARLFDLVGLPPTPAQVDRFVQDTSATAFEK